jgi:hypothetical protein
MKLSAVKRVSSGTEALTVEVGWRNLNAANSQAGYDRSNEYRKALVANQVSR